MTPWIAKTTSSAEIRVIEYFNRNIISFSMTPEFDNTRFAIEKSYDGNSSFKDVPEKTVHFQCQYGIFSLTYAEQVIRSLTGVDIKTDLGKASDNQLALLCKMFPISIISFFGSLSPCKLVPASQTLYSATIKLESQDLILTAEIKADYQFWENIISGVNPTFCISTESEIVQNCDSLAKFPVTIGDTRVHSTQLDNLEIGDLLLINTQFINDSGEGTLSIDGSDIRYQVIERSGKACLKIIEVPVA